MIRTNKVKIMTRAAVFEKHEERGSLYISRFFKTDYIGLGLLKSAISLTFVFGLGVCMWGLYFSEELMTQKSIEDLIGIGRNILLWYAAALIAFLAVSAVIYALRYSRAQKKLKGYRSGLRKLLKLYQEEDKQKERSV